MKKLDMLYEGKAKKVYLTDAEDVLIVDYKDDATAFNGIKKGTIVGKGPGNRSKEGRDRSPGGNHQKCIRRKLCQEAGHGGGNPFYQPYPGIFL